MSPLEVFKKLQRTKERLAAVELASKMTSEFIDTVRLMAQLYDLELPTRDRELINTVKEACEIWLQQMK